MNIEFDTSTGIVIGKLLSYNKLENPIIWLGERKYWILVYYDIKEKVINYEYFGSCFDVRVIEN